MHMPVNWTTDDKSESNASISWGNIGARDNGLRLWLNDVAVAMVIALIFQKRSQFKGSWGSCDGWGTRTRLDLVGDFMGWLKSISAIISVPGYIFVPNCSSAWCCVSSWFTSILARYKMVFRADEKPLFSMLSILLTPRSDSSSFMTLYDREGGQRQGRNG